jgi:hypothetical protein
MKGIRAALASAVMSSSALAQAGPAMETWILVCPASISPNGCNLSTSFKWFQMSATQSSDQTWAVAACRRSKKDSLALHGWAFPR